MIRMGFSPAWLLFFALSAAASSTQQDHAVVIDAATPAPSTINVPVTLDLAPMVQQADNSVPRSIDHSIKWEKQKGIYLKYKIWRAPLQLTLQGNKLFVQAHVYYNLRFAEKVLGKYIRLGSCGIGEPAREAIIKMECALDWTKDWQLVAKTTVRPMEFPNRCKLTFLKFDITNLIRAQFVRQMQAASRNFDAQIERIDLRGNAAHVWQVLQAPISLGAQKTWLLVLPDAVALSPLKGTDNTVTVSIDITANPHVSVGERPVTDFLPLPDLTASTAPEGFHLLMESALPFDIASALLTKELAGYTIPVGSHSLKIESAAVSGQGDLATLAIRTTGVFTGTLSAQGHVAFDPETALLACTDLAVSADSRNALAKYLAEQTLKQLQAQWQDKAKWPLTDLLQAAKIRITQAMNRSLFPGITLHGKITALRPMGIRTTPTGFKVLIRVDGVATVDVVR